MGNTITRDNVVAYGVINAQTPMGSFTVITWLVLLVAGMVSPYTRGASSLNHSKNPEAYAASAWASEVALPFSNEIKKARSSRCSIIKSCHRRRSLARSRGVKLLKDGKASAAALTASSVSFLENSGHVPIVSVVAGSVIVAISISSVLVSLVKFYVNLLSTTNFLPEAASTHFPLMYPFSMNRVLSRNCTGPIYQRLRFWCAVKGIGIH